LNFTAADLAGLTPEMISTAFGLKLAQDKFGQQKMTDLFDMMYKQSLMDYYGQQTEIGKTRATTDMLAEWRRIAEIPKKVDVKVGDQILSVDPAQALSFYAKKYDLPASYETFKLAQGDPEFKKFLEDSARPEPKTPSPMTWTTATQEVTKRFGKLDPTGMWAVTEELQGAHRLAQKILAKLKSTDADPLTAINQAEDAARQYYDVVEEISAEAQKVKPELREQYIATQIKTINEIFKKNWGVSPGGQ
jgi:hypothetical protein